ncbi:nucleotide exchange factor GrpE [Telluribacter sp.]|jgi:molecular chaperone GrpE|uniref:nucleotide exchange factor GrpE n=1 Tax=Telluribacter sp. TaxID=1978767 RepID=UPI002E1599BE|nr:nucleotide exchange factor GrpE [Telluribacter sp.]
MSENTQNNQETPAEEPELEKVTDNEAEEQITAEAQAADPVEELKIEVAELKDKYIRLYADFENFRRRTAKEKLDLIANANADLMRSILPVVDDFERAKQSFDTTTEVEPLKEGVDLIYTKFFKLLENKGLKPMEAKGQAFDAELHESVTQFPAPTEDLKGKVVDEIEKGYYLNDKVLRYAKVVVGA